MKPRLRKGRLVWVAACALADGEPLQLLYSRRSGAARHCLWLVRPDTNAFVCVPRRFVHFCREDALNHRGRTQ